MQNHSLVHHISTVLLIVAAVSLFLGRIILIYQHVYPKFGVSCAYTWCWRKNAPSMTQFNAIRVHFYRAMHAERDSVSPIPSVCLSVCPYNAGILLRRINIITLFFVNIVGAAF